MIWLSVIPLSRPLLSACLSLFLYRSLSPSRCLSLGFPPRVLRVFPLVGSCYRLFPHIRRSIRIAIHPERELTHTLTLDVGVSVNRVCVWHWFISCGDSRCACVCVQRAHEDIKPKCTLYVFAKVLLSETNVAYCERFLLLKGKSCALTADVYWLCNEF